MATPGWLASLDLEFAHRDGRTVLSRNAHEGPLQVQKALYPEGPGICHVTVLHPPGGIACGDSLAVRARLGGGSKACLTTPGAAKWYRSSGAAARQSLTFDLAGDAVLEWLPRETIFFDAARIRMGLDVNLAARAAFFGWEILCFGRRASGERWRRGDVHFTSTIRRAGRVLWSERARLEAAGGFLDSPAGLAGFSVSATFVVAGPGSDAGLLAACRAIHPNDPDSRYGMTALPRVWVARYLGHSSEDAFNWFTCLWRLLRPAHLSVTATPPRLWAC